MIVTIIVLAVRNLEQKDFDFGYLCGLIDGEGWFLVGVILTKRGRISAYPRIGISMKSGKWSDKVASILRNLGFKCKNVKNKKEYDLVTVTKRPHVRLLAEMLEPHLIVKKEIASLFINYPSGKRFSDHHRHLGLPGNVIWPKVVELADFVDKTHDLNRWHGEYKWTGDAIKRTYYDMAKERGLRFMDNYIREGGKEIEIDPTYLTMIFKKGE